MNRNRKTEKELKIVKMSIIIVMVNVLIFFLSWSLLSQHGLFHTVSLKTYLGIYAVYIASILIFNDMFAAYAIGRRSVEENIYSLCLSCLVSDVIFYFVDTIAFHCFFSIWYVLVALILQIVANIMWSDRCNKLYYANYEKPKTLIIYKNNYDLDKLYSIKFFKEKYNVTKKIENPKSLKEIKAKIANYQIVFISGVPASLRNGILKECVLKDVEAYVVPHAGDIILSGGKHVQELPIPMLHIQKAQPSIIYLLIKRVVDIALSIIALLLLWPFMLITALAIKLYDGGPVIYSHIRLTKDGREFPIYKFRSMRVDAEKDGVARLASKEDDRITPIGKIIRMIRFDELPQLFNILNGDMSVVGPRPERPEIAKQYEKTYPSFRFRLQVKAGLTGYAQIYGRYNTEPIDKLKMDLYYINNMSPLFDLKLMIMTVKTLFMKESTEAVDEGKITASRSKDDE